MVCIGTWHKTETACVITIMIMTMLCRRRRRAKRRIRRFLKWAPNCNSFRANQSKQQREEMASRQYGPVLGISTFFFPLFFSFPLSSVFFFFLLCESSAEANARARVERFAMWKKKMQRSREWCVENSGLVFDLAGNRDPYCTVHKMLNARGSHIIPT